jgi:Coenzyme PQQ synthesis protein D (PqqD)
MPTTTEYKRGQRHVYRHVAGEHLLIAIHRDTVAPMFSLTPTAAAAWQQLAEWSTAGAVVDRLVREFDVTRDEAGADLELFLDQLRQISALQERQDPT